MYLYRKLARNLKNFIYKDKAYRFFIKNWQTLGDLQNCTDAVSMMRHSINLEPICLERPSGKTILVIAPHPDDEMLGSGGAIIKAIQGGAKVKVLYLTLGPKSLSETLMQEATNAAHLIGYDTEFLNYHSKMLPLSDKIIQSINKVISDYAPDVLFLPFITDDHDDHRRASHLLYLAHKQKALSNKVEIWAYQVYTALIPNVIVDITNEASKKRDAISCWKSQSASRDWAHYALGLNAYNSRFLNSNSDASYAEMFFVLPAPAYFDFCSHYFEKPKSEIYYAQRYINE